MGTGNGHKSSPNSRTTSVSETRARWFVSASAELNVLSSFVAWIRSGFCNSSEAGPKMILNALVSVASVATWRAATAASGLANFRPVFAESSAPLADRRPNTNMTGRVASSTRERGARAINGFFDVFIGARNGVAVKTGFIVVLPGRPRASRR
jgi:hypothetical protein